MKSKSGQRNTNKICYQKLVGFLMAVVFFALFTACDTQHVESDWMDSDNLTIGQYLEKNKEEYSKYYRLLKEGKLLSALYAYNPYGEDYTLFLPTNEAIDQFLQQRPEFKSFEDMAKDTSFAKQLTRYHTVNGKVHSDRFPDGALIDTTLTGDRLVTGFSAVNGKPLIKVNNSATVIKSNLKMTNGFVHVISGVLQKNEINGYDWIMQQNDYSILSEAIRLANIKSRLWWSKYTILAEPDSIYKKRGINNIDDLVKRVATPGLSLSNNMNSFYLYTAYHFVGGELYLNDFNWGNGNYATLANTPLTVNVGLEIRINPGIDVYGIKISKSGDTTLIDYLSPVWEKSNIPTKTGPLHSITDLLYFYPL